MLRENIQIEAVRLTKLLLTFILQEFTSFIERVFNFSSNVCALSVLESSAVYFGIFYFVLKAERLHLAEVPGPLSISGHLTSSHLVIPPAPLRFKIPEC